MEILTFNLSPKVRRVVRNGRSYLVAPATLIVPGVLPGSHGPLYYPLEEVSHDPSVWNNLPITVNHPMLNNQNVSARDPDILDKQGIGQIYKAHISPKGRLRAEAWFDEEATRRVEPRILNALQSGLPLELSTGLFTDNEEASGTDSLGRSYTHIARNYRPDHVAILPDQIGACSLKDGCGVLVNKKNKVVGKFRLNASPGQVRSRETGHYKRHGAGTGKGEVHYAAQRGSLVLSDHDRELGKDAHQQLQETGHNPPNWAIDESKWARAKVAADKGDYEGDVYWAVVASIYQKMGGKVEKKSEKVSNEGEEDMATKLTDSQRTAIIENLVANCDCWKGKGDKEVLNKFTDEKLQDLQAHADKTAKREAVLNAATRPFLVGGKAFVFNAKEGKYEKMKDEDLDEEKLDDDEVDDEMKKEEPVPKKGKKKAPPATNEEKQMTAKEWMETAPPEIRTAVQNAMDVVNKEKKIIVQRLTANISDAETKKARSTWLMGKPLEDLRYMLDLQPAVANRKQENHSPTYYGLEETPPTVNEVKEDDDDILPLPVTNWNEYATGKSIQKAQ